MTHDPREALDHINMHAVEVDSNIMIPKEEWDAANIPAALTTSAPGEQQPVGYLFQPHGAAPDKWDYSHGVRPKIGQGAVWTVKPVYTSAPSAPGWEELPAIPDDDADFTPDMARKIIAKYQQIVEALSREAPASSGVASIVTCCVTGAIPGDGGACGDCDPCIMGEASVPEAVKRLIAEKNSLIQRIGESEDALENAVQRRGIEDAGRIANAQAYASAEARLREACEFALKFIESEMSYSQPAHDMGEEPSDKFTYDAVPVAMELRSALSAVGDEANGSRRGDLALAAKCAGELCDDCPPVGYPTDKTRCLPCPRRGGDEAKKSEGGVDWDDVRGIAPNATGDLSSEAFIREQRDSWDDQPSDPTADRREIVARIESRLQYEIAACEAVGRTPSIAFSLDELRAILAALDGGR